MPSLHNGEQGTADGAPEHCKVFALIDIVQKCTKLTVVVLRVCGTDVKRQGHLPSASM